MAAVIPARGGTTGRLALTVGSLPVGELLADATEKRVYMNDGIEAGGIPIWHTDLLSSNNKTIIKGVNAGTPVNNIQVSNRNTGAGPIITAVGTDTNIDLNINTKGDGALNLVTGGAGDVILGRNATAIPITKLNTNPAWTTGGGLFYNSTDEEWYSYDSGRSKFLGLAPFAIAFGRNATGIATLLWTYGGWDPNAPASKGIRIPYNSTIVGYTWNSSAISTPTVLIRNNASTLITVNPAAVTNQVTNANANIDSGQFLNVIISAGTMDHPQFTIFLKRRS